MSSLIPVECVTCFCLDDSRDDCLCQCHPINRYDDTDMTSAEIRARMAAGIPCEIVTSREEYLARLDGLPWCRVCGAPAGNDCEAAEFYENPANRELVGPGRKRRKP